MLFVYWIVFHGGRLNHSKVRDHKEIEEEHNFYFYTRNQANPFQFYKFYKLFNGSIYVHPRT